LVGVILNTVDSKEGWSLDHSCAKLLLFLAIIPAKEFPLANKQWSQVHCRTTLPRQYERIYERINCYRLDRMLWTSAIKNLKDAELGSTGSKGGEANWVLVRGRDSNRLLK
jgi:hypothetical protein